MKPHAILSASSAHRWLNCPPSVRLSTQVPSSTSKYAEEGTLAHEIAELKLSRLTNPNMPKSEYVAKLKVLKQHELYQPEMLTHTETYFDYVNDLVMRFKNPPFVAIEKRVDFSAWVSEGFGTADGIVIAENTLHVVDFKYGKGVAVEVANNPQLQLYALGAYEHYKMLYDLKRVVMVIIQPRLDHISEWAMTLEDLLVWGESVKLAARLAFEGRGDFKVGDHCRFCPIKSTCRARVEHYSPMVDFKEAKQPELLSNDELGELLIKAQGFDKWLKDLQERALAECLKGNAVKGWKAVEGRGSRGYVDIETAFAHLQASGIDEAVLYEKVPLTAPKMEKLLGKKDYTRLLSDHVVKQPGKPTLAPETDKRAAFQSAEQDFKFIPQN